MCPGFRSLPHPSCLSVNASGRAGTSTENNSRPPLCGGRQAGRWLDGQIDRHEGRKEGRRKERRGRRREVREKSRNAMIRKKQMFLFNNQCFVGGGGHVW